MAIKCTEISAQCPVEATTYGYYPNLGINTLFLAIFAICTLAQIIIGYTKRVYAYSGAIATGCLLETIGYAGRVMMNNNPWNESGFRVQIICLILAPSFIAGGIYLTIKHTILYNGPEYSRLKPKLYTWIFIGCDIGSIVLQAAGGGVASSASTGHPDLLDVGNNMMIAGIAFQVVTMAICGLLSADFALRYYRGTKARDTKVKPGFNNTRARLFTYALAFSYTTVLIRCIYRLPEMAGGWGNPRMRNETEFLVLDGLMIALAAVALTTFHPGYFYPIMTTGYTAARGSTTELNNNIALE